MKKRMIALALASAMLLAGCGRTKSPDTTVSGTKAYNPTEEQIQYDWMAGESPVPTKRMGVVRAGLNAVPHAVSETGTYFIYAPGWIVDVTPPSPWILYVDHGSDTVIKLCGRPDCAHDTADCNAFISGAENISYYGGYLYVVASPWENSNSDSDTGESIEQGCKLLRMDPDGTNRVEAFDFGKFAKETGADGAACDLITEGYCLFRTTSMVASAGGGLTEETQEYYYYKLDGSMGEPKVLESNGMICYNCGDVILTYNPESQNGGDYGSYWDWDPETDTLTYLTDHPGKPGWFGEEEAYYFKDGAVRHLTYATQEEEIVIDTGLEGNYYVICLPDCLVVADNEFNSDEPDMNLYIYNWAFELVDAVPIDFDYTGVMVSDIMIAETAERLILTTGYYDLPQYYINKSELGTGNVEIHAFDLSDMKDVQQSYQEYLEDEEWFENG